MVDLAKYVDERFASVSALEMRELGLEALRVEYGIQDKEFDPDALHPLQATLSSWTGKLARTAFPMLPEDVAWSHNAVGFELYRAPRGGTVRPHTEAILGFWHWMVGAGLALADGPPRVKPHELNGTSAGDGIRREGQVLDATWILTPLGRRRLATDHPCRPGALGRLQETYRDTRLEDAVARFVDAQECVEHGLLRPAVVLLGLAYEELMVGLHAKVCPKKKARNASERQEQVRKALESLSATTNGDRETRMRALTALNVADDIRTRRNDAAHAASSTFDPVEVDELLADGIRAFRKLADYEVPA